MTASEHDEGVLIDTDICVIGGGPAGAAAAIHLCRLGYRVCVVERQGVNRPSAAEALPDLIVPLLQDLGILSSLDRSRLLACGKTRIDWGASPQERRTSVLLVDRSLFDSATLDAVRRAGAVVFAPARCRRSSYSEGRWSVAVDAGNGSVRIGARFLVQATGRRGNQVGLAPRMAALCGRWRGVSPGREPEMRLAAGPLGWLWGAPLADGSYALTCFVDASRCAALDRRGRQQLYRTLIVHAALDGMLECAELIEDVRVRDATCRRAAEPVTDRSITIGDAAFAMDPISSQGVQSAFRSSLQASIVVNTVLGGGDIEAAITFYRQAQRSAISGHLRMAGEIYASQSGFPTPFWLGRSIDATRQERHGTVRSALAPDRPVRLSSRANLQKLPVIEGTMIRSRLSLSSPDLDRPVAWFGGVEVAPLLTRIRPRSTLASLSTDWSQIGPPNIVQALLGWLVGEGILISDDVHEQTD